MKKVCIVYPYKTGSKAFSGGVSKVIVSNIISVHKLGCKPILILPKGNDGLKGFVEDRMPYCQVYELQFKTPSLFSDTTGSKRYLNIVTNSVVFLNTRSKVKKLIRSIAPDIIHFHEVVNFPFFNVKCKCLKILHLHSFRFLKYKLLSKYVFKLVNDNIDIVFSPTNSILDAIGSKLKVKSVIINTPYLDLGNETSKEDISFEKPIGKLCFSFVGRICSVKRLHHFVIALSRLNKEKQAKLEFLIVGGTNNEGEVQYKVEIEKIIRNFSLEKVVRFVGYVNPIEKILPIIDYGVILSESEAVPMIGIEYMKFNIPIIGYNAPGVYDFLTDGLNGFLIENGSIDNIVKLLNSILEGREKANRFKDTIPLEFDKYSNESFTENLSKYYLS